MNNKISRDLFNGAFGKYPHDVYMAYDELADELIIKVIDPSVFTYVHELDGNNTIALLVEADSNEVVGFQLFNFQEDHLRQDTWPNLMKDWENVRKINREIGFTKLRYDPNQKTGKALEKDSSAQSANILNYQLHKVLA